ncbi:hypothetical protein [Nocardia thraciensis]
MALGDLGSMAILADSSGAGVGVWQPRPAHRVRCDRHRQRGQLDRACRRRVLVRTEDTPHGRMAAVADPAGVRSDLGGNKS